MKNAFVAVFAIALLSACATVKIDHDGANTINHDDASKAGELADQACSRARSGKGKVISTVNKDPSLPEGTGKQVTTFRCTG